jgi:hypothetical protein
MLCGMRTRFFAFAALLCVSGCGAVATTYAPQSAVAPAPATESAVRFFDGDIPAIAAAGGRILGRLEASGYAGYERIRERSSAAVAKQGGTHFILDEDDVAQRLTDAMSGRPIPERAIAPYHSDAEMPVTEAFKRKKVIYLVVHVPPENWGRLPEKLRPLPTLTAATLAGARTAMAPAATAAPIANASPIPTATPTATPTPTSAPTGPPGVTSPASPSADANGTIDMSAVPVIAPPPR